MKKLIAILTLTTLLFSNSFNLPSYKTSIISLSKDRAFIADSPNIVVGSSAVVLHQPTGGFDGFIVARGEVVAKDGKMAALLLSPYEQLTQKALPNINIKPSPTDRVLLNHLYNRVLLIAPNKKSYDSTIDKFRAITFINSDLMAASLFIGRKPNPTKKEFQNACYENEAGAIFFVLDGESFLLDCHSFKILKSFKTEKIDEYQLPFYSRVKEIKTSIFNPKSRYIKDYNSYYRDIIGVKNDR